MQKIAREMNFSETMFGQDDDRDLLWMKQNPPDFGPTVDAEEMAEILGLDASEIDARFPMQEVSTGKWFVIVPLVGLEAVKRARVAKGQWL